MQKMIINIVIDNGISLEEHEFNSFTEMIQKIEKGILDRNYAIHTLYYKNEATKIEFCWNEEMLHDRGYTILGDVEEKLHNNTFAIY